MARAGIPDEVHVCIHALVVVPLGGVCLVAGSTLAAQTNYSRRITNQRTLNLPTACEAIATRLHLLISRVFNTTLVSRAFSEIVATHPIFTISGIFFPDVTCAGCYVEGVAGIHWQCAHCYEYYLCHSCYLQGRHCQEHPFFRIQSKKQTHR